MAPTSTRHRPTCYRCRKPTRLCLCGRTAVVSNRTPVLVLQHRRERAHAVGTARIARLGLADVEVREVIGQVPRPALRPEAALLFPGPGARDLATLPPAERPGQLVVLDGTWHHARRLFRDNPWLQRLPRVRLEPEAPSRYRIRLPPRPECVSTIESIVAALRLLEPETTGLDRLLFAFDAMIDDQLAFMSAPDSRPRFQVRGPRPSRAVPSVLLEHPERLLVVYGETAPVVPAPATGRRRQLVTWSAIRPATGEAFDELIRPRGAPPVAAHLAHMGLRRDDLGRGASLEEVARRWRAFLREGDLVAAWNTALLRMLRWLDPDPGATLSLKTLWSNVTHERCGALDELVTRRALPVHPAPVRGRAARRLGRAAAVARHLVELAPRIARMPAAHRASRSGIAASDSHP